MRPIPTGRQRQDIHARILSGIGGARSGSRQERGKGLVVRRCSQQRRGRRARENTQSVTGATAGRICVCTARIGDAPTQQPSTSNEIKQPRIHSSMAPGCSRGERQSSEGRTRSRWRRAWDDATPPNGRCKPLCVALTGRNPQSRS